MSLNNAGICFLGRKIAHKEMMYMLQTVKNHRVFNSMSSSLSQGIEGGDDDDYI